MFREDLQALLAERARLNIGEDSLDHFDPIWEKIADLIRAHKDEAVE